MPNVTGKSVYEARKELLVFSDIGNIEEKGFTGDEGGIWDSGNWKVCTQSIKAGEKINSDSKIVLKYTDIDGSCKKFDGKAFAKKVEKRWKSGYGLSSKAKWSSIKGVKMTRTIKKITSKKKGHITVEFSKKAGSAYDAQAWATKQLNTINARSHLVDEVTAVIVDSKGKKSKKEPNMDRTKKGLDKQFAHRPCEEKLDSLYPYGAKTHWIMGVNDVRMNSKEWKFNVDITIENASGNKLKGKRMICHVGGTNDKPVLKAFEIR